MTTAADIEGAVLALRRGELVVLPTETVYGVAADPSNPQALRRLFAAKGRPESVPLPVLLPDAVDLAGWASEVPETASRLAARFWPGPLTLVVPRAAGVLDLLTGGLPTVGLRVPAHPLALALLRAFGGGLAVTSANRHGEPSPTTAAAARDALGPHVAAVLDGGPSDLGVESTVLDLTSAPPLILRLGSLPEAEIEGALDPARSAGASGARGRT